MNKMLVNSTQTITGIQPEGVGDKTKRETAYDVALKLIARIDEDLTRGVHPYRDRTGRPLTTLDEVVRAILAGSLPEGV